MYVLSGRRRATLLRKKLMTPTQQNSIPIPGICIIWLCVFFQYYHYICIQQVLYFISSSSGKGPRLISGLIGNCVQITSCPATVSNTQVFTHEYPLPNGGKDGKNVTSQETCLYCIDNAFVE